MLVHEGNKAETKSTCLTSHSVLALAKYLTSKIPNFDLILTWNQPALSLPKRCRQKQKIGSLVHGERFQKATQRSDLTTPARTQAVLQVQEPPIDYKVKVRRNISYELVYQ